MKPVKFALLACDVFEEEITTIAGSEPPFSSIKFLEMGLHDQPDELRRTVGGEIARLEADPEIEAVALAYGRCGNGLVGIQAQRCPLILPQAHDCISILLGGRERHDAILKENPGTYFYSPGWIRGKRVPGPDRDAYLRTYYEDKYGDDEEMIEELIEVEAEAFLHHNRAAYVSIIDHPESSDYCRSCARHLNWEHRAFEGDPGFLTDLIKGRWDPERFLTVSPGSTIGADREGKLVAVASA